MSRRLLLDTQVAVWLLTDDARLADKARSRIADSASVHASHVSLWEIAIRRSFGGRLREQLSAGPAEVAADLRASGVQLLAVEIEHLARLERLPLHHRDPFARLLIAQASHEPGMRLLTADRQLAVYGSRVILA